MRPAAPRWLLALLLALVPLLAVGNFFAYHAPGAIGASLQRYFSLDSEDLAWLFTIYSAPNVLLVLVAGVLMDRYGLVRTSLLFNLTMLAGTIVFACAPRPPHSPLRWMLVGRFLLGVGGECLCAAASAMLARWFKHTERLNFAMGLNSAAVQILGSAPPFLLLPLLLGEQTNSATDGASPSTSAGTGNVRLCLWVVVGVCALSVLANVLYALLEVRYGSIYIAPPDADEFELQMSRDMMRLEMQQQRAAGKQRKPPKHDKRRDGATYSIVQTSSIEEVEVQSADSPSHGDRDEQKRTHAQNATNHDDDADADSRDDTDHAQSSNGVGDASGTPGEQSADGDGGAPRENSSNGAEHAGLLGGLSHLWRHNDGLEPVSGGFSLVQSWRSVRSLPLLFWLVLLMHCLLSPILYSFTAFGPQFFSEKYGLSQEESGFLTSLLYLSVVLAPLFGALIDRVGFRCIVQTVAAAIIPTLFLLLHLTTISPYVLMSGLGVAFAVTDSNGLAMVADVSPAALLGTSYGLVRSGVSLCLLFEPWAVGVIHLRTAHYYWSTLLFIGVSFLGWAVSFAIYVYDVNHQSIMAQSAEQMRADQEAAHELQQSQAYPELEIVFEEDHTDDHELEEFKLDEFDTDELDALP